MPHRPTPASGHDTAPVYQIRFAGHLDSRWDGWFGCLTISPEPTGDTLLTGTITDQAALHGILARIRDLGLELISIDRMETGHDTPGAPSPNHQRKDQT